MTTVHSIAWWPSIGVLLTAAIIDASTRRIPNWLTLPFLAAGILVHFADNWDASVRSIAGIGLAALLFGPPCTLRLMGMGDFKLAMGVGAWIGPGQFVFAFLFSGIVAGLMAASYALFQRPLGRRPGNSGQVVLGVSTARFGAAGQCRLGDAGALAIPYAPAFAIGTLFSFFGQ
jgi:prepilin peptidase CpaA